MILDPNRWPKPRPFTAGRWWRGPLLFVAIAVVAFAVILVLAALTD